MKAMIINGERIDVRRGKVLIIMKNWRPQNRLLL